MGDDSGGNRLDTKVQKQKDALAKAKSVVQRPPPAAISSQPQNVTYANPPKFITYPEFAPIHQGEGGTKVSLHRLLLVLYLSAGTAATIYIVSKVILLLEFQLNS
jgi:hypothetical protein